MTAAHPSDQSLAAYGLGKMDDTAAESVLKHLEGCEACRRRVAELSASSFEEKFLAAREPGQSGSGYTGLSAAVRAMPRDDGPPAIPPELLTLTQYTVLKELGRGGMGVVYLAKNTDMDRLEVLKVMQPPPKDRGERVAADQARFVREIQSAAKLQHPNVVTAYTVHRPGDLLVFAMEYAPGRDLAQVVKDSKRPLPVATACSYVVAAANGLQHAHERGMVHRDIKPGNLILTKSGSKATVKVLDFGLAKVVAEAQPGHDLTGDGKMMGTPAYMAPEQAMDAAAADIRADVYSLGCTLYFLLTGRPPFAGNSIFAVIDAHRSQTATALNLVRPDVPAELAAVVARMMAKEPGKRFQTPADVIRELRPFVTGTAQPAAPSESVASSQANTSRPDQTAPEQPAVAVEPARTVVVPAPAVAAKPGRGRLWAWLAVGLLLNLVGAALLYGVVFKTPDGTIYIDGVPADAEVQLDGVTATVTRDGESVTVTAVKGPHALKVVQGGRELLSKDEVVVTVGGGPVRVRVEPPLVRLQTAKGPETPPAPLAAKSQAPVRVESPPLMSSDGYIPIFANGAWTGTTQQFNFAGARPWRVVDGLLSCTTAEFRDGQEKETLIEYDLSSRNYAIRAEVMVSTNSNAALTLRTDMRGDRPRGYSVGLCGNWIGITNSICRWSYASKRCEFIHKPEPNDPNSDQWFWIEAKANGTAFTAAVNGNPQVTVSDTNDTYPTGRVGFVLRNGSMKIRRIELKVYPPERPAIVPSVPPQRQSYREATLLTTFAHPGRIMGVAVLPDSKSVVSCSQGPDAASNSLRRWDAATGAELWRSAKPADPADDTGFYQLLVSPSGKHIVTRREWATTAKKQITEQWDAATGKGQLLPGNTGLVAALRYTPDGRAMAGITLEGVIARYETATWTNQTWAKRPATGKTYDGYAILPDCEQVLCSRDGGVVEVVGVVSGKEQRSFDTKLGKLTRLYTSPNGNWLVAPVDANRTAVWDIASGKQAALSPTHPDVVRGATFSPDGRLVVTGDKSGWVIGWDVTTGVERFRFQPHTAAVFNMAFSADGKRLATAAGSEVKVWEFPQAAAAATTTPTPPSAVARQTNTTESTRSRWVLSKPSVPTLTSSVFRQIGPKTWAEVNVGPDSDAMFLFRETNRSTDFVELERLVTPDGSNKVAVRLYADRAEYGPPGGPIRRTETGGWKPLTAKEGKSTPLDWAFGRDDFAPWTITAPDSVSVNDDGLVVASRQGGNCLGTARVDYADVELHAMASAGKGADGFFVTRATIERNNKTAGSSRIVDTGSGVAIGHQRLNFMLTEMGTPGAKQVIPYEQPFAVQYFFAGITGKVSVNNKLTSAVNFTGGPPLRGSAGLVVSSGSVTVHSLFVSRVGP